MLQDNPWLAALIFIVLIVGANGLMYVIARGAQRDNKGSRWWHDITQATQAPWNKEDKALDELRQRVKDLREKNGDKQE
jgi:hypothetical protein